MSLPDPDVFDDKHISSAVEPYEHHDINRIGNHEPHHQSSDVAAPSTTTSEKPRKGSVMSLGSASRFLEAPPFHSANRPMSPDAFSNLSVEEYDQLRPVRSGSPAFVSAASRRRASEDQHEKPYVRRSLRGRIKAVWIRNLGLLYMLVAMLFGTLMNVTTRMLEVEGNKGKGLHPFQILFARMSITVLLAMMYMWWTKTPHFPFGAREVRWLLVARGMGGFFGVFGMYYSLLYLPMADATVITFLAPSLSCWACSFLINEPFTRIEKIGSLVAFVGVIFIARPTSLFAGGGPVIPPGGHAGDMDPGASVHNGTTTAHIPDASNYDNVTPGQRLSAVGLALVGVCGSVCAFTTIRWIGKRAHPLISVNYFAVWCTIVSTIAQLTLPGVGGFLLPADAREWGLLIFLGACGFIMQFLLAAGLSYEKSSRATNMTYTSMLYALAFDKFVFGQTPGVMSIIGSTLILGSAIYMAVRRESSGSAEEEEAAKEVDVGRGRGSGRMEDGGEGGNAEEGVGLMEAIEDGETRRGSSEEDVEMRDLRVN